MASINTANCYHLEHLGAISPGKQADLVLLSDPKKVDILSVYHKGKRIEKEEKIFIPRCPKDLKKNRSLQSFEGRGFSSSGAPKNQQCHRNHGRTDYNRAFTGFPSVALPILTYGYPDTKKLRQSNGILAVERWLWQSVMATIFHQGAVGQRPFPTILITSL